MSKSNKHNKAFMYRCYPNVEQIVMFAKTFGCTRFVYNKMLEDKIAYYREHQKMLYNTPAQYKDEFQWLREVDSLALANAQLHQERAFANFFRDESIGFPHFKSKNNHTQSYTTNNQNGTIAIVGDCVKLPKVGLVKIEQHRPIPEDYKIKSATIKRVASGKYYISILCEYEKEINEIPVDAITGEKTLGLDYSMHEVYVSSNGDSPAYSHYYRNSEAKLHKEQRKLSLMVKGSNNRNRQRVIVARLHEKVANHRKDFLHKESRQIANAYDCVCIEDLNMKSMSQALYFGKSVSDNGWGMFTNFLEYKLQEQGKKLIRVDKFYPSSQLCHTCGYKNEETKDLSVREWTCPNCNTHHDRDINAAINIKTEGLRLLRAHNKEPWDTRG